MLRSPDPGIRDEIAYPELCRRISSGEQDASLIALGEQITAMLSDPEIQARTFAALILGEVVDRDRVAAQADVTSVRRWRDTFGGWYVAETDLRGWDRERGWLHAVAHGADALLAFGRTPRLDADSVAGMLTVAADRLLVPTGHLFAAQEDDRLAYAMAGTLARPELDAGLATGWLQPIRQSFDQAQPGPVPIWASNTMHTLRMLYLLVDRGFLLQARAGADAERVSIPHRDTVREAVADAIRMTWPPLG